MRESTEMEQGTSHPTMHPWTIFSLVLAMACWFAWTVRLWVPPLVELQLLPALASTGILRPVDPLVFVLLLAMTFAASVAASVALIRRWWALIPCLVSTAALLATLAPTGLWWSGHVYYQGHRDEFAEIAAFIDSPEFQLDPAVNSYQGVELPASLSYLSADGKVAYTSSDSAPFMPVWFGMPDNAGGFFYSLNDPADHDMYGLRCDHPTKVAEHWWACGMP